MKSNIEKGLTEEKKKILKSVVGSCSCKGIDLNAIIERQREAEIVSMEHALKDVTPIQWSDDVLSGKAKVIIK